MILLLRGDQQYPGVPARHAVLLPLQKQKGPASAHHGLNDGGLQMLTPNKLVLRFTGHFDAVERGSQDFFIKFGNRHVTPLQKPQRESDRAFAVVALQQGDKSVQLVFPFFCH